MKIITGAFLIRTIFMIMNLRIIIREEMGGLEWIKNVKSNQDIAQEIADDTEIDYDNYKVYSPFVLLQGTPPAISILNFLPLPKIRGRLKKQPYLVYHFLKYCKNNYGLTFEYAEDVWNRYREIMENKLYDKRYQHHQFYQKVNESDDMQWIKDITPIKIGDCLRGQFRKPLGHRGHADDYTYLVIDIKSFNQVKVPEIHLKVIPNAYHNATIIKPLEKVLNSIENGYMVVCDCLEDCHENINESDELDWIKDVSDQVPPMSSRKRIDLKDFIIELVKDSDEHMEVLQMLLNLDLFTPSDKYIYETGNNGKGFTPEEYDDFGVTNWLEGAWLEDGNSLWSNEPSLTYVEINELLEQLQWANGDYKWSLEDRHTNDYDLEYGRYQDRYIFKNKIDGSHFALDFDGSSHDGIEDNEDYLYQVYPKKVTKIVYESKIIKRAIKEEVDGIDTDFDWVGEDLIKVGNCFLFTTTPVLSTIKIKVSKIEVPTYVEKWLSLTNHNFLNAMASRLLPDRTTVHFTYLKMDDSLNFKLTYSEVEQWLEQGDIVPTDCNTSES